MTNLDQLRFSHDEVKNFVKIYQPKQITNKQIFRIWRLVLCGCLQGPPVHEIATFFGSDVVRKRFENALRVVDQQNENVQVKL